MPTRIRLVVASALMLFLELSLIRWTGAHVLHLSYFSNFVLLGSFVGIGLGFLRAPDDRRPAPYYSPVVLLGLVGFISAYPVTVDRKGSQLIFFTSLSTTGPPIWLILPAIFLAVAVIMAGPGELVGECFQRLPRLEAYRYDLVGSLIGITAFTGLAFLDAPPFVWFTIIGVLYVALLGRPGLSVSIALLVALLLMFIYPLRHDKGVFWSPYYQVTTIATADSTGAPAWDVQVNGIPHQRLTSAAAREKEEPWYSEPYLRVPRTPQNALIVGAGTGTDIAIALSHGVRHVDAVEIDPTLLRFGRQNNPNHVYQDPRVTSHVNDGRAYLQTTHKTFDLILFALPDSLTLVSGASSLRLESYLFTDDKPFLYVRHSTVPSLYVTTLALILLASLVAVLAVLLSAPAARGSTRLDRVRHMWSYRDLFLLGAAFLLLETKNVTGFALLFGTTWLVNAFVFGGVLIAVLGAVEFTRRRATPALPIMYGLLLGGLVLAWAVPASWLLSLTFLLRVPVAIVIAFLPIFAANVIFSKRFAATAHPTIAFATNLLGAMLGGALEYLSLAFGYRALLLIAAILYLGAYAVMPRDAREDAAVEAQREPVAAGV